MTKQYDALVEQVAALLEGYSHELAAAWREAPLPRMRVDLAHAFARGFVKDPSEDVNPVAMGVLDAAYALQRAWKNETARQAAVA